MRHHVVDGVEPVRDVVELEVAREGRLPGEQHRGAVDQQDADGSKQRPERKPPPARRKMSPATAPRATTVTAAGAVAVKAVRVPATTSAAASPSGRSRASFTRAPAARSTITPQPRRSPPARAGTEPRRGSATTGPAYTSRTTTFARRSARTCNPGAAPSRRPPTRVVEHHSVYSTNARAPSLGDLPAHRVGACCERLRPCPTEKAASTSASTSTPNQPSTPTASQGTGSTGAQHTTSKAREQTAAQATPKHQELSAEAKRHLAEVKERIKQQVAKRVAEARRELEKKPLEAAANTVPLKKQYSVREQFKFVTLCKAAKGSHLDCECVLVNKKLLMSKRASRSLNCWPSNTRCSRSYHSKKQFTVYPFPAAGRDASGCHAASDGPSKNA